MTLANGNNSPIPPQIVIIDDDAEIRYSLHRVLTSHGYTVETASNGRDGIALAHKDQPKVIFLDNRMEGMSGIETLQHLRTTSPNAMVILMTAFGTTQTAIEAMKYGAYDYIIKPFDVKRVLDLTEGALKANRELESAKVHYTPVLNSDDYKEGIVGSSEKMQGVFKMIGQVAANDFTVLITGESGTGKELVARCLHQHSHLAEKPFMAVNCAAIPENLIESELFGHEKGAFTGATQQRIGIFEQCDGGTIFLDEIGDMAPATQTKILRALQQGEIQRVGGTGIIKVKVRMIAATNKDLEKMVAEKTFREDLYYRLNVVRIRLPSLRERLEDIPPLVEFMLQRLVKSQRTHVSQIAPEALEMLMHYRWPGNVRELENVIQRATVMAKGETILPKDLPPEIHRSDHAAHETATAENESARETTIEVSASEPHGEAPLQTANPAESVAGARVQEPAGEPLPVSIGGAAGSAGAITLADACDILYERLRASTGENILDEIEKEMIVRALKETGGNQVRTSSILGITRATLRKRIDDLHLHY
jgi:two-component system nitrogen regulation response regulator GlnG